MKKTKILITGGMGFIGSNLAHRLVSLGAEVTILDAMLEDYGGNMVNISGIEDKVTFIKGDIRDYELIQRLVKNKDCIFNFAAQVGRMLSMKYPHRDIEINCIGNINILEACRRVNPTVKIIYSGSRGQIGEPNMLPVDETHPDKPTDIYGINKLAAEQYHLLYNHVYGIKSISLRLCNVYGPRCQMQHSHYGIVNWFIRNAMLDEPITVYGNGEQTRDYIYIDDVIDAIIRVSQCEQAYGEKFIIGSGIETKFIDMVKSVIKVVGKGKYEHVPWPPDCEIIDIKRFVCSYKKLQTVCGWQPRIELEEGISKTVEYYTDKLNQYI